MSGIYNLLDDFPDQPFDRANSRAYNFELSEELEHMRDIVVLHHSATQRNDARLWRYCESMPLPHNLRDRIDLYRGAGRTRPRARELVADLSWFYTFDGLGIWPASYDPSVRGNGLMQAAKIMWSIREQVLADVRQARPHDSFFSEPVAARAAQ